MSAVVICNAEQARAYLVEWLGDQFGISEITANKIVSKLPSGNCSVDRNIGWVFAVEWEGASPEYKVWDNGEIGQSSQP